MEKDRGGMRQKDKERLMHRENERKRRQMIKGREE